MGYQTIYRRKNLTSKALKEFIKPYLLRGLKITHTIRYGVRILPSSTAKGFMHMTTFIDVYSPKIVGWGISNSMSKQWYLALSGIIERFS